VARARPRTYDLIVVEAPDPTTARANRYSTLEFFRDCARALARRGVVATTVGGAVNALGTEAGAPAATLRRALGRVFAEVAIWPGETVHMYAAKERGVVTDDSAVLAARYRARGTTIDSWSEQRFDDLMPGDAVAEARRGLDSAPVAYNTDSHPVAYIFALDLWDQRARGEGRPSPLWAIRDVRPSWLVAPLLVVAAVRLVVRRRARSLATDGVVAVLSGGFFGLAIEVVLLLSYQNVAGSLYQALGLLVGLFMAGLAGGTLLARLACRRRSVAGLRGWARLVDLASVAVAAAAFAVPLAGGLEAWAAGGCLAAAGLCTGATFPSAVALVEAGSARGQGRAAGIADAADHLGACAGALLVGLVALPVGGAAAAVLVVVAFKAVSLAGLVRRAEA
jgi:spermidine synthase